MRFTVLQLRIMRVLLRGSIPISDMSKLDQRPLRALYMRHLFRFSHGHMKITNEGWEQMSEAMAKPAQRKDAGRPTFVEAAGRRERAAVARERQEYNAQS